MVDTTAGAYGAPMRPERWVRTYVPLTWTDVSVDRRDPVPYQRSLFALGPPGVSADAVFERLELDAGAWIDVARAYVEGADQLLDELIGSVGWKQGRRWMYDRMVDDPRLSHWARGADAAPHPALRAVADDLARHYGRTFPSIGLNYYRSGDDSVAFHRDRELRELDDTIVAIVTFGARRPFLLRPEGGGASVDLSPGSGDLVVMGGSCQMHYEHGVPKRRGVGPRVSASFRWSTGVDDRPGASRDRVLTPPRSG
jgi:alkylated DNA repair dioxygenase AlkB